MVCEAIVLVFIGILLMVGKKNGLVINQDNVIVEKLRFPSAYSFKFFIPLPK